ncbi:S10 family peptidase [Atopobium fossor]|uniref:S10 family peptidase n=1 Tax=Atopobium fossor TaxID=39487 RepID=UPI00041FCA69|nr:peptidase S10 [Atopobium fossor]
MSDTQETSATSSKKSDEFRTVPADLRPAVPEAKSAQLTWSANGKTMDYVVTAGHLDVREDAGALLAQMFSISYVALKDGKIDASRPVTFAFNGGPGSASVPVNFGGIGPVRVETNGVKHVGNPEVKDNPYTLLQQSDLVFLDAPGTGWSTLAEGVDSKKIFGIDGDASAFACAIQEWLEKNNRWGSPLYLFGESYGTIRNSQLMRLLGEQGVHITGVVMLSAIFNWVQTLPGEDLYYLGMMPTYAATAQFFDKAGANVDEDTWFDRAMDFTEDVLAPALLKGDRLSAEEELKVAEQLADFIGLPAKFIAAKHLRIDLETFRARLLEDEGKVAGRLDTRFASDSYHPAQTSSEFLAIEDAALDAMDAPWNVALRTFLREKVGYVAPTRYLGSNYLTIGVNWDWNHASAGTDAKVGAPNVSFDIATALRRSPTTKLAILGGRFDAATTYWNVVHDMSTQFLSDEIKQNIEWHRYGCGHMAYVDVPTLVAMYDDLKNFYETNAE